MSEQVMKSGESSEPQTRLLTIGTRKHHRRQPEA
jgi:hypothetical protein